MSTPLIENAAGFILAEGVGVGADAGPHYLDAFQAGGELFLKITITGASPRELTLRLNPEDARTLAEGLARGSIVI